MTQPRVSRVSLTLVKDSSGESKEAIPESTAGTISLNLFKENGEKCG